MTFTHTAAVVLNEGRLLGSHAYDIGPFRLIAYPLPMGGSLTATKTIDLSQPLALAAVA